MDMVNIKFINWIQLYKIKFETKKKVVLHLWMWANSYLQIFARGIKTF